MVPDVGKLINLALRFVENLVHGVEKSHGLVHVDQFVFGQLLLL